MKNHAQTSNKLNASFLFRNLFFSFYKIPPLKVYCLRVKHFSKRELFIKWWLIPLSVCRYLLSENLANHVLHNETNVCYEKKCCYSCNDIKECVSFPPSVYILVQNKIKSYIGVHFPTFFSLKSLNRNSWTNDTLSEEWKCLFETEVLSRCARP